MELRSSLAGGAEVGPSEFMLKLSEWWRNERITDAEWEQWAASINVKWVPVFEREGRP
jgi:hypothetical protein